MEFIYVGNYLCLEMREEDQEGEWRKAQERKGQ